MRTPATLAATALGLAAVFGAALGVGAAVGPVGPAAERTAVPAQQHPGAPAGDDTADHGSEEGHP